MSDLFLNATTLVTVYSTYTQALRCWQHFKTNLEGRLCSLVPCENLHPKHLHIIHVTKYPFHIKPIMQSQRHFENNGVWCECSQAALFDTRVRKAVFDMGGLQLPREVFWKCILAKSRSLRRCSCQCERVRRRIMQRERPKVIPLPVLVNCMYGWKVLYPTPCTHQTAEIRTRWESKLKHTEV